MLIRIGSWWNDELLLESYRSRRCVTSHYHRGCWTDLLAHSRSGLNVLSRHPNRPASPPDRSPHRALDHVTSRESEFHRQSLRQNIRFHATRSGQLERLADTTLEYIVVALDEFANRVALLLHRILHSASDHGECHYSTAVSSRHEPKRCDHRRSHCC